MMRLIKVFLVIFLSNSAFAKDNNNIDYTWAKELEKCIRVSGATGMLADCYVNRAEIYQKQSAVKYKQLLQNKNIKSAYKKKITSLKAITNQTLVECELKLNAYDGWEKPPEEYRLATLGDVVRAKCIHDIRKHEYETYSQLLCLQENFCAKEKDIEVLP